MHDLERLIQELEVGAREVEQEKAKSDALFSSIGDGALATDEVGRIRRINHVALKLLGYKNEAELIGKWYPKTILAADEEGTEIAMMERPITRAFLTGRPVSARTIYKKKDGSAVPVAVTVSPILLDDKPVGAVEVFRDITQEKAVERAKDEFISLTSHQLRTPLTSIRLFSEMMCDEQVGKLNEKQKEYIERIFTSTERMIHLVGDILNVSRIELGRLKIEPTPVQLDELITSRIKEIEPVAHEKDVSVTFKTLAESIPKLPIDSTLMEQVIHNLLTNAVRYTEAHKGKIEVSLSRVPKGYQLAVKDNGIGIPEADQPRIFSRFFRADNAQKAISEGTGLGLYLVKMIVELSGGGKIWFKSKVNEGTTFYVTIPSTGMKKRIGDRGLAPTD